MRSHIDDIVGLIDRVLGTDDGGPVPSHAEMIGPRPSPAPRPYRPEPRYTGNPVSRSGPVGVHALGRMTFEDLERFLGDKPERTLAHNTRILALGNGTFGIQLHRTVIFTFWREPGDVTRDLPRSWSFSLNSGGYETVTTKQRMNALLPAGYRVFAEKFQWYVKTPDGQVVRFHDGITFEGIL